jgi:hypothetical protein
MKNEFVFMHQKSVKNTHDVSDGFALIGWQFSDRSCVHELIEMTPWQSRKRGMWT